MKHVPTKRRKSMMRISRIVSISTLLILMLVLTACNAFGPQTPATVDPNVIKATVDAASTQAVLTIAAQLTSTALAQPTNTPTVTLTPTLAVTSTPLSTSTPMATATNTRVPFTLAPTFTSTEQGIASGGGYGSARPRWQIQRYLEVVDR